VPAADVADIVIGVCRCVCMCVSLRLCAKAEKQLVRNLFDYVLCWGREVIWWTEIWPRHL